MFDQPIPPAVLEILADRQAQLALGARSPEGDDRLVRGELAIASALYLLMGNAATVIEPYGIQCRVQPLGRRANLVRGIALALAELERYDRAQHRAGPGPGPGENGVRAGGTRAEEPGGGLGRAVHPACVERCSSPVCFNCK